MKVLLAFTVLLLSPVIAPAALAQNSAPPPVPPPNRPRVGVDQLLNGHPVTASFDELQAILDSGYEVVVTDDAGRVRRGRVASISRDQLVMASPVAAGSWEALLPLHPRSTGASSSNDGSSGHRNEYLWKDQSEGSTSSIPPGTAPPSGRPWVPGWWLVSTSWNGGSQTAI